MTLREKIEDWKRYPNALGSESQVACIVGSVAAESGEDIPGEIKHALKILSLRGTMRDMASAIQRMEEYAPHLKTPSFDDVVDAGAASCGISWAEALAVITRYLDEKMR